MPYQSHPVFTPPSDPKTKLWRYLDFPKFVALLQRRALWFSAAHLLGDSFEGSYTLASTERRRHLFPDESESYTQIMGSLEARYHQGTRNWTYINCWHMGDQESAAMFYAGRGKGIAIRSSFERLTDSLESQDSTYVGMVRYIDYSSDWIPTNNLFWPFLHKRKSFEHERELRAIIHRSPNPLSSGSTCMRGRLPTRVFLCQRIWNPL